MEVSNASLYDGGSARGRSLLMAVRAHRKSKSQRILVPDHRAIRTTARWRVAIGQRAGRALRRAAVTRRGTLSVADLDEVRGRGHHRHRHPAAELLRRARRRRRASPTGRMPTARWSSRSVNPTSLAHPQAAGRVGHEGRRHRLRRLPAARRAAVLGRPVRRLHHHADGIRAPDAGPHRRPHGRPRRQARASRSRCRRASSTSAAARRRRTSAPTRACWSRRRRST